MSLWITHVSRTRMRKNSHLSKIIAETPTSHPPNVVNANDIGAWVVGLLDWNYEKWSISAANIFVIHQWFNQLHDSRL